MSWGTGSWGTSSWGTGGNAPPPTLISVASLAGTLAPTQAPAVVAEKGGTVCLLVGTNFFDPTTVEIGIGTTFTKIGEGYIFDPEFDISKNRVYFATPPLVRGVYNLRVVTEGGTSNVLQNVISARLFADEYKVVSVRGKFSEKWATGPRILRGF